MNKIHQKRVQNLSKESFDYWKDLPETKIFLDYLEDFRQYIGDTYKEAFINGTISMLDNTTRDIETGKCLALQEIGELEIEDLYYFYEVENEDEIESSVGQSYSASRRHH